MVVLSHDDFWSNQLHMTSRHSCAVYTQVKQAQSSSWFYVHTMSVYLWFHNAAMWVLVPQYCFSCSTMLNVYRIMMVRIHCFCARIPHCYPTKANFPEFSLETVLWLVVPIFQQAEWRVIHINISNGNRLLSHPFWYLWICLWSRYITPNFTVPRSNNGIHCCEFLSGTTETKTQNSEVKYQRVWNAKPCTTNWLTIADWLREIIRLSHDKLIMTHWESPRGIGMTSTFCGAFHSTKISGNTGSKSNKTEIFRKFVSTISVHLSRLSFSGNFLSRLAFPLVVKSYIMAACLSSRHYAGCKMVCHSSSLFLIENENVRIWSVFSGQMELHFFSIKETK